MESMQCRKHGWDLAYGMCKECEDPTSAEDFAEIFSGLGDGADPERYPSEQYTRGESRER